MKKLLLVPLLVLTGCLNFSGWQTVRGSGTISTENREVSGFDHVSVSGSGELVLVQGEEESVTIEADDNLLPLIRTEVSQGGLFIGPRNVNLHPTQTIVYRVKLKNLRGLELSGSVRAEADTIKTDRLALSITGSGKMQLARLDTGALSAHISGSGTTTASGRAERQDIHISGSGNHEAFELKSSQAKVNISGSGHASLWVTDSLSARISGSGRVGYRGDARVDSHISGSGRVHHQGG